MPSSLNTLSTTFGLTALKSVSADFVVPVSMRECRIIIKDKDAVAAGKVSQFCCLPEVTDAKALAFAQNPKGLELIKDLIAGIEDKITRKIYLEVGRSPCEADYAYENLFAVGAANATSVRLSKESIGAWFEEAKGRIAAFIATRMFGEEFEAAKQSGSFNEFYAGVNGQKVLGFAANYKASYIELAGKSPSFDAAVKPKLELVAAAVMTGTAIEEKMLEKLADAVVKSADQFGL